MSVPARVSLVTLGVADLPRAVAFYEALGWVRSASSTDEVAFFPTAGAVLALFPTQSLAADAGLPAGDLPAFRGVAIALNVESATEVDHVMATALAAGATVTKVPQRADWGGYSGYFTDLDGHAWEVAHNPFWPIGDDGVIHLPD